MSKAKPATEKALTTESAPAKVSEETGRVKTDAETMLERAKLIADLAAAWQNEDLMKMMRELPNGQRVTEIFSDALNREMAVIMTGKKDESAPVQAMSKQVEQMSAAMGDFRNLIVGFMQSPLVQVLDLMAKNLGARGFVPQQQQMRQQPAPQDDDDGPSDPGGARGTTSNRAAPGLGSF